IQHVEAGRLAGAVRADESHQLSWGNGKRHIAYRLDAPIGFAQVARFEAHRRIRNLRKPAMPCGNAMTSISTAMPTAARQYATSRASSSCSQVKSAAPHTGPVTVCNPPSRTITRPSTERPMESDSGEMEPLE